MWPDIYDMSDEEFDVWFQSLPPQEQMAVTRELQMSSGTTGAFAQDAPEVSPASWDISTMFMPNPDVDAKGRVEPWDLSNQAQGWNYVQDQMQSAMSPSSLIFGGMGSYDPSLFEPTTVYGGPTIDTATPGLDRATALASGQGTGWTKMLAADIAEGVDPSVAVGNLVAMLRDATENPDLADDPVYKELLDTVPKNYQGLTLEQQSLPEAEKALAGYDLDSLQRYALDLSNEIASDPRAATGYEDPRTGVMYQNAPTTEYSKIAQSFIDAGLPFPTERYDDPARIQAMAPVDLQGWESAKSSQDEYRKHRVGQARAAGESADTLADEYAKWQQELAAYQPAGSGLGGGGVGARGPAPGEMIAGVPAGPGGAGARPLDEKGTSLYGQELFPGWAQAAGAIGGAVGNAAGAVGGAAKAAAPGAIVAASPLGRTGALGWLGINAARGLAGGGGGGSPAPVETGFTTPQGPQAPQVTMQNGQWTTGVPKNLASPNFQAYSEDYSPIKTRTLDQSLVDEQRKKADWANYLVERDKNRVGVQIGNKHGYYQAPGTVENLYERARARRLASEGRTPLTDAYMQRLMGMQGFGMR